MPTSALIRALRCVLPEEAVRTAPEELRAYECDGLSAYRCLPQAVVLPESAEQVQKVLAFCSAHAVPVVARGAGTGLSGGALPVENGVLLCLTRLNRILSVDPDNRLARVQPGVSNLAISQAAKPYGLYYAPDPSSQIACTIGGNVAENAGGVHCLKYGLTVNNVLGLKFVTAAGEAVSLGGAALSAPGLDILALLHGSEGLLGVITEVTVRLLPLPEAARTLLAAFASVAAAAEAVAALICAGLIPAGLEMMDRQAVAVAEDFVHAGYPREAEAILLVEVDGFAPQVEEEAALAEKVLKASGAFSVQVACDQAERQRLWAGRKAAFAAVGRVSPDYYCMDGTIPRQRLAEVLAGIADLSRKYGLKVANVFHAGDGNLHPLILYDAQVPGEFERVERLGEEILALCVAVGGTITGEHGVGVEKLGGMCSQFSAQELAQFHAIRRAFDPEGLLNPGKAIPTVARCVELGRMHVRRGRLAHSELERF
ncbi:glycolate oxidase subunit GlcD [Methylothermus subterraneus]